MSPPAAGQRRGEGHGGRREGSNRHQPGRLGRGQVGLGLLDHGQDALGMRGQPPSRVGQLGGPGGAVKQRHPCLPLQRGKLLGHGRGRVAERGGRGHDRAALGELLQQPQPVRVKHQISLRYTHEIASCTNSSLHSG
jgi:hypothetical protein